MDVCAISGVFNRRGSDSAINALAPVVAALEGYGSSGATVRVDHAIGFGYRTTGPASETASQFLHDPSAGIAVVADLTLYNRDELRDVLDPERKILSDIGLLTLAWQKWREECPAHLNGDFAFALWDSKEETLFCARDHVGARPFYYAQTKNRFVFASDLDAIQAAPDLPDDLDDTYIAARLARHGRTSTGQTHLSAVRRLPPGHSLTIDRDRERLVRYWRPENAPRVRFKTDAEYGKAAQDLIERSVADRLRTAHPVGVHLSGGLDSSGVAVLAARVQQGRGGALPVAFCYQPPPVIDTSDAYEHWSVRHIADAAGVAIHYCPIVRGDVFAALRASRAVAAIPINDQGVQSVAMHQGIRVILTGLGGDDGVSFNGRGYSSWRLMARSLRGFRWPSHTPDSSFLHPDVLRRVRSADVAEPGGIPAARGARGFMFRLWNRGHLTSFMEALNVHGAPCRIRYAHPLLDRRLLEFVAGVPPEQFIRAGTTRWLMRNALRGILPTDVLQHTSKRDPIKSSHMSSIVHAALSDLGGRLDIGAIAPARRDYIDLPRFQRALRPEEIGRHRMNPLLRTIRFLEISVDGMP
jgi:asparagine synthase (glutamine-hydrolysing)